MTEQRPSKEKFRTYKRVGAIEARPYERGDQATHNISISEADLTLPTLVGGMVARNPDNHDDMWYVTAAYFAKHYSADEPQSAASKELAYRDALARIRQVCRSDAKDFETATIERHQVYDIANMALDAHGDLYASGHEPPAELRGNDLYQKKVSECQAIWRTNMTLVCTLPKGHDGDHRADCGYTFNGEVDVRAAQPPSALRAVVQSVVDWNTKYPSGRVYDYGAIKGIAAEMDIIFQQAKAALDGTSQPPATEHPDKARLDWLNEQPVHFIELDDFSIIDVRGLDVRAAIDARRSAPTKEVRHD